MYLILFGMFILSLYYHIDHITRRGALNFTKGNVIQNQIVSNPVTAKITLINNVKGEWVYFQTK